MCGRDGVKEDFDERLHRYIIVFGKNLLRKWQPVNGERVRERHQASPPPRYRRRTAASVASSSGYADRLGGLHILGKGVGGHGDNRHTLAVIARAAADGAGRIVAVPRAIDRQPAHFQQFRGNLGIELIVLYQQHAPPGLPAARFPVARTDVAPRKKSKTCPTPLDSGAKLWYTISCRRMNRLVHVVCWLSW